MSRERLYIIHGKGNDAVGLVGSITTPISKAGGNVVDLRQDVLHGLFTLYMVVDLAESGVHIDDVRAMLASISEESGLYLTVDPYFPVPRRPDKKSMLLILIGPDRPGIIASISATLGNYRTNIEFSKTIAREGIFLAELLTDVSHCSLPPSNLTALVEKQMSLLDIRTIVQADDVFNKKKRVILFDFASSLVHRATRGELLQQTGIDPARLGALYSLDAPQASVARAASLLEGFPLEVMSSVVKRTRATPDTMELLQTLKTMGYRLALRCPACSVLTEHVRDALAFDHCFGVTFCTDDDAKTFTGDIDSEQWQSRTLERTTARLMDLERVGAQDITVVSDRGLATTPGLRLEFDLEMILNLCNDHIVGHDQLLGILGSFGIPA